MSDHRRSSSWQPEAYKPPSEPRRDPRTVWVVEVAVDVRPGDHPASAGFRRKLRATAFAIEHRAGNGNAVPEQGDVMRVFEAKQPETLLQILTKRMHLNCFMSMFETRKRIKLLTN